MSATANGDGKAAVSLLMTAMTVRYRCRGLNVY